MTTIDSPSPSAARYRLEVVASPEAMARRCSETIASAIDLALAERDRCQIALAGGRTPAATYRQLGQEHLPWERVDLLLGDERWVPVEAEASNARLLRETLMAGGPGREARLHPVPTHLASPAEGARAYAQTLAKLCGEHPPVLDLVLLGLGEDGHTASLFPGTAATAVTDQTVTVSEGKGLPRITLTAPVLSAARRVVFLVSGADKCEALGRLLDAAESVERTPARLVRPAAEVLVFADRAAAEGLEA
ncbi:6-phosphogluconolactonase [Cyanobium sp. CH-040]|uniref:6-phosphogluconolactonase n=1 Tax=Cyanobium sp. CH-040 TaxID=2823708 RepID=UPI0020CC27E6|nr:6-phosphogluconolactonase [Cyanobium sp. CH-040]MCP9926929.1 6-phosphogluconolactonase [Cyanobium sp. CH-040]